MKREIAAFIFSFLIVGTALAGPIESSDLPPPAESNSLDSAKLRGLIDKTLNEPSARQAEAQSLAHEDWNAFYSAELWLEGVPEPEGVSLDALAQKQKRYPSYGAVDTPVKKVPTAYKWENGNWRANVTTDVTTATSPTSPVLVPELNASALDPNGGSGTLKGRVEYDLNAWQFYGGTNRSLVANQNGTVGVSNNFTGGTYYNLPPSFFGGKVGTGFEVDPLGDAKTRVEYRKTIGDIEGFLSAERSVPFQTTTPDVTGNHGLKAGFNRKF